MVILITGISSGFGLETARLLAGEGHVVYGTVRREVEPLPGVHYLKVDVRDRNAVKGVVQQVVDQEGRIDVLVNNAGMGIGGPVEFATEEEIREQMDANFMGLVNFVTAVLRHGQQDERGPVEPFGTAAQNIIGESHDYAENQRSQQYKQALAHGIR